VTEAVDHRAVAVETYNRCWDLLEKEQRSTDDDVDLLTCAFASRHHWRIVGGAPQAITADWMISRAAAEIGNADLAVDFARLAFDGSKRVRTLRGFAQACSKGSAEHMRLPVTRRCATSA
jgi:hypothetical protein